MDRLYIHMYVSVSLDLSMLVAFDILTCIRSDKEKRNKLTQRGTTKMRYTLSSHSALQIQTNRYEVKQRNRKQRIDKKSFFLVCIVGIS